MAAKRWSCKLEDGNVTPCDALESSVDSNWMEKRKGIFVAMVVNRNNDSRKYLYGVRSGEHMKKGVIFNHCPFCGVEINPQTANVAATVAA